MAINYNIEKHATGFPSKVLAQEGGKHIYNVKITTDTDNGNFVARGDYLSLDLYEEKDVETFTGIVREKAGNGNWYVEVVTPGDALFVYNKPLIAEEWTNSFKKESNFYNVAGEVVRAYELAVGDMLEISAEGFSGTPSEGANVTGISNKKATIA